MSAVRIIPVSKLFHCMLFSVYVLAVVWLLISIPKRAGNRRRGRRQKKGGIVASKKAIAEAVKQATEGSLTKKLFIKTMPSAHTYPSFVVKFRVRCQAPKTVPAVVTQKYRLSEFLNAQQFSIADIQTGSTVSFTYCSFSKIQLRGIKIYWSTTGYQGDQWGAQFWGDFPKGTVKTGQTHQPSLDDFLTPAVVASKVIPAMNEGVVGRPLHSFSWSSSDQLYFQQCV